MPEESATESVFIDFNLFTPIVEFSNTQLDDTYRVGDPYQVFVQTASQCVITFMVPPAVRAYAAGKMYLQLNHCRTTSNAVIDMFLNGASYPSNSANIPSYNFGTQTYEIPYSSLNLTAPNTFSR